MHWYTCKCLLNTLGRAVEQLAGCLAKETKVSSRGQSTTVMQRKLKAYPLMNIKDDVTQHASPFNPYTALRVQVNICCCCCWNMNEDVSLEPRRLVSSYTSAPGREALNGS